MPKASWLSILTASAIACGGPSPSGTPEGGDGGGGDAGGAGGGDARAIYCGTQWPPSTRTAAGYKTEPLYVQLRVEGVTPSGGKDPNLRVEVGYGPEGASPDDGAFEWFPAEHNPSCLSCGGNDEFVGEVVPAAPGSHRWAARVSYAGGAPTACDRADQGRAGSTDGFSPADASPLEVAAPGAIRAVSVNLRCLVDGWDERRPILADAIAKLDPDALLLQEVCEGGGRDGLAELLTALSSLTGRAYASRRAVTHASWDVYQEGLAVASPHWISGDLVVDLPAGVFPRKVVLARVVGPQGPAVFATTHLDYKSADVRLAQAEAALAGIAGFAAPGEAVVFGGDLNETPSGDVHALLQGAGMVDLWKALRPAEPGHTYPASAPKARIDYVWLSPGSSGLSPKSIDLFLGEPVAGTFGSDHLGLGAVVSR